MQESKRQKQIAALLHEELSGVFNKLGLNISGNSMISISKVAVTPDLAEARIYLSFFQVPDVESTMKKVEDRAWEIKRELVARVAKQLRRMPELKYFHDDTLDYVFRMEKIFDELKQQENPGSTEEK